MRHSYHGEHVKAVHESPAYPMQLMLSVYELPGAELDESRYPKVLTVDDVRGYRPS